MPSSFRLVLVRREKGCSGCAIQEGEIEVRCPEIYKFGELTLLCDDSSYITSLGGIPELQKLHFKVVD